MIGLQAATPYGDDMTPDRPSWRPSMAGAARVWKAAPIPTVARKAVSGVIARGVDIALATAKVPAAPFAHRINPGPIVVSGFHSDVLGLGTAARLTTTGLRRLGYAPIEHDVAFLRTTPVYESVRLPAAGGGVWIAHMNPPELARLLFMLRNIDELNRYRIGYWAWELDVLPPGWAKVAAALHEIWTPSRFVQRTVRNGLPANRWNDVKVVPHAIEAICAQAPPGVDFPWEGVSILTMADFRSTALRKNPEGAIRAYIKAFPNPPPHGQLICKFIATDVATESYRNLRILASNRPDIIFLDKEMNDAEVLGLVARCEVLLSLHRSEGYGLTLAEAMRCGRCVVATGWSGNMDFMDDSCAIIVPYDLVPVGNEGPYGAWGGQWAEPDVEFAAEALRMLVNSPQMRERLGAAAAARLAAHDAQFSDFIAAAPWRNLASSECVRGQAV
jgi:glycosyltransferase involved in cell wall biosynthesis